ncbi:MAG TPA: TetR/AcrR family transcriptional regulator C-terminal domain-containing protein [Kribbella sp.]|nr:TetR/AcrR family transcriptional regulator C-terminal domain-containing protein [Kribbella sp.]
MATQASEPRTPLSRDRVLRAAVAIADADGIDAVTMRRIGDALGAEAMSLYYHVANKDALLDGIVELVMTEINDVVDRIDLPAADWKAAMRRRVLSAREVMLRHPWAPRLFETRTTMSPAVVLYHDRLVGLMHAGGFSYDLAHHALHALGSRALGFSQELFDPSAGAGAADDRMLVDLADQLPNLTGMLSEIAHDDPDSTLGWCDDQAEFEFALDLILDGLDRLR